MHNKYKQGGKIDRAALVDTNTAIATKNKLKKNFDLPFEVAVYVPSTSDANRTISKQDFENRINEVSEYLANVFGGFSSNEVSGGYVSSEKGLIKEGVYKVTSFASKENLDSNMKKLISQIKKWCKDWSQESIGLEFEGDLYYLSETAEYKNGGIMYAKGGKVKKDFKVENRIENEILVIDMNMYRYDTSVNFKNKEIPLKLNAPINQVQFIEWAEENDFEFEQWGDASMDDVSWGYTFKVPLNNYIDYLKTENLYKSDKVKNGGIMYAQGGDIESIQMDMDLIKKQYPKAKVSYYFAKTPNGKNYVIEARENNEIVYSSYYNKYAQGGDIIDLFDKYELINLIKTYDFKSVDVSNMETISYSKSENPFNKFDVGTIKLSPLVRNYHDSLLIVIDKQKGKYIIRIGEDRGWTGGLEQSSVELTFDIPKLTFEEFKKGFLNATINQNYCLVSKYGTGNIDTIHFQGNLQEIKDYALENGYELKENSSPSIFDFYFYKKDLPLWRNDRLLQVYVLSSQQIDNITERNEGSKYAQGGEIENTFTYQIGGL